MELDIYTIYEGVYVPTGSASCQVSSGGRKANLCSSALWAIDRKWAGISEWRKNEMETRDAIRGNPNKLVKWCCEYDQLSAPNGHCHGE